MNDLGPDARALLRAAQGGDDPSADDAARVREKLALRLSLSAAAGAAATLSSPPTAGAAAANVATTSSAGTAAGTGTAGVTGTATVAGAGIAAVGTGTAGAAGTGTVLSTKLLLAAVITGSTVGAGAVALHTLREEPPPVPAPRGTEPARRPDTAPEESTNTTRAPSREPPASSPPPRALPTPTHAPHREPPPPERPSTPSGREPSDARRPASPRRNEPAPPAIGAAAKVPAASGRPSPRNEPAPPAIGAPVGDSVADEAALLRSAHAALTRGDGTTALRRLEAHAARFPRGALTEERQAARVFALCAAGRALDARAAAARFLTARPASPLAAQVRVTCAEHPSKTLPPKDDSSTKRTDPTHP